LYRYSGEQWDPELGMYYLRARYYNPDTDRFWTMDSFEGIGQDPLSLHKYLYAHDDPINNVDPSGMYSLEDLKHDIAEGGEKAAHGVAAALKAIAEGAESAEALGKGLMNGGAGITTSIMHGTLEGAAITGGRIAEIKGLYPKARSGQLNARGTVGKVADANGQLIVPFGKEQFDVKQGGAPIELVMDVDGSKEFILFFMYWHELGNGKAGVTLYYPVWNKTRKQFVPDWSKPVPIDNVKARFLGVIPLSTGVTYTFEVESVLIGF
jgi:RHS repeat-associated protein